LSDAAIRKSPPAKRAILPAGGRSSRAAHAYAAAAAAARTRKIHSNVNDVALMR